LPCQRSRRSPRSDASASAWLQSFVAAQIGGSGSEAY
jgi:hypothetical protein